MCNHRPTILIVDDQPANLHAMERLLSKVDAEVVSVGSGNEGLTIALKQDLALVLLDVQMPDMDGYEMAELMRGEERTREVPVIFLSAVHKDTAHQHKGYGFGAVDYLQKPIDELMLLSKIRVFLELWRKSRALKNALDELVVKNKELLVEIEHRKRAEEQLKHLARYDSLTSLPNRVAFKEEFSRAIARAQRFEQQAALLFMDIDGFKPVNDDLGHDAGDSILVALAARIQSCMRELDTVARFGGDEFLAVLSDVTHREDMAIIATRIIETLSSPLDWNDRIVKVGVSIGIAVYPDDGETLETLTSKADKAMYIAKRGEGSGFEFAS